MTSPAELPPFVTKAELSRRYRRSVRSIERDIAAGRFKTVQVGGRVLIPRSEVLLFEHRLVAKSYVEMKALGDQPTTVSDLTGEPGV